MTRFALVYVTRYGQTRKIADRLALELQTQRAEVDVFGNPEGYPERLDAYDAVILGGPVYVGRLPTELLDWTRVHSGELSKKDVALFSVGLSAFDEDVYARRIEFEVLDRFCAQSGICPRVRANFKGALPYTRCNWVHRTTILRFSRSLGGPTDVTKDHEVTNWSEVAAFARACFERTGRSISSSILG